LTQNFMDTGSGAGLCVMPVTPVQRLLTGLLAPL
jgi:hypothetical protein